MFEDSASAIPSSIWASMNSWFTPTVLFVFLNVMIGTIAFTSTLANQKKHHDRQNVNDPNHPKIARSPSFLHRLKSINFYANHTSHQELQSLSIHHKPNADSESIFNFENAHQEQTQSRYFFQTTHQENLEGNLETAAESESHYIFEQTREEIHPETESHEDFEEKDTNLDGFQKSHGENHEAVEGIVELQSMDEVYSQLTGGHFSRTKSDTEPSSGAIKASLPTTMKKSASLKSAFGHFKEEEMVEARRPATVRESGNASKMTDDDDEVDAKADDFINRFKQQLKLQRLDSIIRYKDVIARASAGR